MSNKTYTTFLSYIEEVPKEIRIKHCDIHAPCTFKGKNGNDYTTKRRSQESAYENLVSFLIKIGYLDKSLLGKNLGKGKVSVNHLCKSTAGIGNSHDPPILCPNIILFGLKFIRIKPRRNYYYYVCIAILVIMNIFKEYYL